METVVEDAGRGGSGLFSSTVAEDAGKAYRRGRSGAGSAESDSCAWQRVALMDRERPRSQAPCDIDWRLGSESLSIHAPARGRRPGAAIASAFSASCVLRPSAIPAFGFS